MSFLWPGRHAFSCLLSHCDVESLARAERACFQWREFMISGDGVAVWQTSVHRFLGRDNIEAYKSALGLKCGQDYEKEKSDLTARNWKRILRMHKATVMLPKYHHEPEVVPLLGHSGPVLCMCLGDDPFSPPLLPFLPCNNCVVARRQTALLLTSWPGRGRGSVGRACTAAP